MKDLGKCLATASIWGATTWATYLGAHQVVFIAAVFGTFFIWWE